MARYRFSQADNLYVQDTNDGSFIPVSGNWRSAEYQAWLVAGNVTDPYVAPTAAWIPPANTLWIPPATVTPDPPPTGTLIYNDNGTPTVLTSTGTTTNIGDK